jgi:hypothetical protein
MEAPPAHQFGQHKVWNGPRPHTKGWRLRLTVFYSLCSDIKKEIGRLFHPYYFLTTLFINFICIIQNKIFKLLNRLLEATFWQALLRCLLFPGFVVTVSQYVLLDRI